jgi:hypothetical protein
MDLSFIANKGFKTPMSTRSASFSRGLNLRLKLSKMFEF